MKTSIKVNGSYGALLAPKRKKIANYIARLTSAKMRKLANYIAFDSSKLPDPCVKSKIITTGLE